jgi:putative transposase
MGKQRKSWSVEQKLTIVLAALSGQQRIAELSREYGVNENQIYRWREQFLEAGRQGLNGGKAPASDQRLEAENEQLKKLLGEKALELDIIKKALSPLSVEDLDRVYRQYQGQVSLKGFRRMLGQPYWRLRDYRRGDAHRRRRDQALSQAQAAVSARRPGADTSYGYRQVHRHLRAQGVALGREGVRRLMG